MRFGVGLPSRTTGAQTVSGAALARYATRAEEYGFAGAWALEHLLEPPSYESSFGDPLTTLATVAGATDTLDVGTSIMILPMRNPVLVAKRAATIQQYAPGRLTLGVGQGYVEAEYDAVNVPFAERHRRFTEGVELLSRLLREDRVTFDGEFYQVEGFELEPKVSQPPRLLVAGGGRERDGEWHVADSVTERMLHADGWVASSSADLPRDWAAIAEFLDANGRDPRSFDKVGLQHVHLEPGGEREAVERKQYNVFDDFVGDDRGFDHVKENLLVGTVEEIRDRVAAYEREGFDELILNPAAHVESDLHRRLRLWRDHLLTEFA